MEGEKICCLHRKTSLTDYEHELIKLSGLSKITIGRAVKNDVVFTEVSCISRQHAVLEKDEKGLWSVMDLNSGNGIHINGSRISPGVQITLRDRDLLEIGKDPTKNTPAHYSFTFYRGARIKVKRKASELDSSDDTQQIEAEPTELLSLPPPLQRLRQESPMALVRQKMAEQERLLREEMLAKEREAQERINEMEARMAAMNEKMKTEYETQKEQESKLAREREEAERKLQEAEEEAKKRISALQESLEAKENEKEQTAAALKQEKAQIEEELERQKKEREDWEQQEKERIQELAQSKEAAEKRIHEVMNQLEKEKEALEAQEAAKAEEIELAKSQAESRLQQVQLQFQEQLKQEQEKLEKEMRSKMDEEVKMKEESLKTQLSIELQQLQHEREQVEKSLKDQVEKEKEKEQEYEQLKQQQEQLSKVIADKEQEQKQLAEQLEKSKSEAAKAAEARGQDAKKELVTSMEDLMETELVCSICSELLVQTMSLNCSHSFCSLCISKWMDRKKECPNCRAKITSCVRSLVLDNYIDKMTEHLSGELGDRRKNLVQERKEEQAAYDAQKSGRPAPQAAAARGHPVVAQVQAAANGDGRRSLEAVINFAQRHAYVPHQHAQNTGQAGASRGPAQPATRGNNHNGRGTARGRGGAVNRNPFSVATTSAATAATTAATTTNTRGNARGRNTQPGRGGNRGGRNNNRGGANTARAPATAASVDLTNQNARASGATIDLTRLQAPRPVAGTIDLTRPPVTTVNGLPVYQMTNTAGGNIPHGASVMNFNVNGQAGGTYILQPGQSLLLGQSRPNQHRQNHAR